MQTTPSEQHGARRDRPTTRLGRTRASPVALAALTAAAAIALISAGQAHTQHQNHHQQQQHESLWHGRLPEHLVVGAAVRRLAQAGQSLSSVLLSIKSTLSDPTGSLSSWGKSSNPCDGSWYGVLCDGSAQGQQLSSLVLSLNTLLSGPLPDAIKELRTLKSLYLTVNSLSGTLPASWSSLGNLEVLVLRANQVTGTLPSSWGALGQLRTLSLGANNLMGTVPFLWSQGMSSLTFLDLSGNTAMCGPLPGSLQEATSTANTRIGQACPAPPGFPDLAPPGAQPPTSFSFPPDFIGDYTPPPPPPDNNLVGPSGLQAPPPPPPSPPSSDDGRSWIEKYWWVIVVIVGGVLLLLLLLVLLLAARWRREARRAEERADEAAAAAKSAEESNQELKRSLLQVQTQLAAVQAQVNGGVPPAADGEADPNGVTNPVYSGPTGPGAQPWTYTPPRLDDNSRVADVSTAYQHFYSLRHTSEVAQQRGVAAQDQMVRRELQQASSLPAPAGGAAAGAEPPGGGGGR